MHLPKKVAAGLITAGLAGTFITVTPMAQAEDPATPHIQPSPWGDDGIELKRDQILTRSAAQDGAVNEVRASRMPTPHGRTKVVVFNVLNPTQGEGSGWTESKARNMIESTATWFRTQGVTEQNLGLEYSNLVSVSATTELTCDLRDVLAAIPPTVFNEETQLEGYDSVIPVAVISTDVCPWAAGMGYIGSPGLFVEETARVETLAHEIGHNLGLDHSASITSADPNDFGTPYSYPYDAKTAKLNEYGDQVSVMGLGSYFPIADQMAAGFTGITDVETASRDVTLYTLQDANSRSDLPGARTLVINYPKTPKFAVEFRRNIMNSWGRTVESGRGVTIRILDNGPFTTSYDFGEKNPLALSQMGLGSIAFAANSQAELCGPFIRGPQCTSSLFQEGQVAFLPDGSRIAIESISGDTAQVSIAWEGEGPAPDPEPVVDTEAPKLGNVKAVEKSIRATVAQMPRGSSFSRGGVTQGPTSPIYFPMKLRTPTARDNIALQSVTVYVNKRSFQMAYFPPDATATPVFVPPAKFQTMDYGLWGGKNSVAIEAVDRAGNTTRVTWTVNFVTKKPAKPKR